MKVEENNEEVKQEEAKDEQAADQDEERGDGQPDGPSDPSQNEEVSAELLWAYNEKLFPIFPIEESAQRL